MRQHAILPTAIALFLVGSTSCETGDLLPRQADVGVNRTVKEYPKTGVTKRFELTISEFDWEVGPGAIYQAIGYNKQIPGPKIEVNAGDRVELVLKNETKEPHSAHTHIVRFDQASDGVHQGVAPPGGSVTVYWDAVFAGSFPYHDHAGGHEGEAEGIAAGMFGPLIVHAPDEAPAAEQVVMLSDFDLTRYKSLPGVSVADAGAPEVGTYHGGHQYLHTMNGKGYDDAVPPFRAKVGDIVRWRVISIGKEFHTFHVHGHRWVGPDGVLTDNINLGPGTYSTFEWKEDLPGRWLVHCHVPDHMEGGMIGHFIVSP